MASMTSRCCALVAGSDGFREFQILSTLILCLLSCSSMVCVVGKFSVLQIPHGVCVSSTVVLCHSSLFWELLS